MPVVDVRSVSKKFGDKTVVDNVSLQIESGEIFGLLGSNGAGKSTLISMILGLEKPSKGKIVFFEGKQDKQLKKMIGLVPQESSFYKDFSVKKNLNFFASIYGLKKKDRVRRVDFLLEWLGLKEFISAKAGILSGGYQRLLNIAITLLHNPQVLFLDEPTSGLDPKMRRLFWEKIRELKKAGKTIIITTHYMDEAENLCSKIALMKKGKLLATGTPQELIKQYGGIKVLILEVPGGVSPEDIEGIKAIMGQKVVIAKNELLFIPLEQEHSLEKLVFASEWLMKKGYDIKSSTTKEPNLEDVFLNITGETMHSE